MNHELSIAISSVIITIGILGNVMSIFIFNRTELKKHSATVYLTLNSLLNIVIVTILPFAIIPSLWEINDTNCKIYSLSLILFPEIQGWILLFCSLDRLFFVLRPKRFLFKDKLNFKLSVFFAISIIIFLLIIPNFVYNKAGFYSNNETSCLFFDLDWVLTYFKLQFILFRTFIPFVVMITSSILISRKMYKMRLKLNLNKYDPNRDLKIEISVEH
jgi:hypothetical protein